MTVNLGAASGSVGATAFTLAGTFAKVVGSIHDDRITGTGQADHLIGDYGNDTLIGGTGADTLVGGAGRDMAVFAQAVTIDLTTGVHGGEAAGDIYSGIEIFALGDQSDNFVGGDDSETILGGGGNDTIDGRGGDDRLDGGHGADTMTGGTGSDVYVFNTDGDVAIERRGEGEDTVISSVSTKLGANIENLSLIGLAKTGTGNALGNDIEGNARANRLDGQRGNDVLDGKAGRDKLLGGGGNDTLIGGTGADILTGGTGRDHFVFNKAEDSTLRAFDMIRDFKHGTDKIDVSAIDANGRASGNAKFQFIGERDFSGKKGELSIDHTSKSTIVLADVDGNGHADLKIVLAGHMSLTSDDFIL